MELECYQIMMTYRGPKMPLLIKRFNQTLYEIKGPLERQKHILKGLIDAYEAKEFVDDSLDEVVLKEEAFIESKWVECLKDMKKITGEA